MAHGAPDWFGAHPQGLVHRISDMAELAARLGSPDVFDRRGNVMFMCSFENGASGWTFLPSGGVAAGYPSANTVRGGALCLNVFTDALAGAGSIWYRFIPLPMISRFGVEIAFGLPTDVRDVLLSIWVFTGTVWSTYTTRWRQSTGVLSVLNAAGAWETVASPGPLRTSNTAGYVLKMVADPMNLRYVRIVFNAQSYDASTIAPQSVASATPPVCAITFGGVSDIAGSVLIPFDDIIFTVNE